STSGTDSDTETAGGTPGESTEPGPTDDTTTPVDQTGGVQGSDKGNVDGQPTDSPTGSSPGDDLPGPVIPVGHEPAPDSVSAPEPATLIIWLGLGGIGLIAAARKRSS